MATKMLRDLGAKLGLVDVPILKQAHEYSSQMDCGPCAQSVASLRLSQTCKLVICLDLAATRLCQHLQESDKMIAVKLSGLTKKAYLNSLKAVESLLGVQQKCTIKELTVQFGCTSVADLAERALNRYQEDLKRSCVDVDFCSTLFLAAAVNAACIQYKCKIDRRKLRELCSVKKSVYDKLVAELQKYTVKLITKKCVPKKKSRTLIEEIEEKANEMQPSPKKQCMEPEKPSVNYEEWKRRILEQANRAEAEA